MMIVLYSREPTLFDSIYENVELQIGGVRVLQYLYVVKEEDYTLLFDQPFSFAIKLSYDYYNDV
jgi:hypothetical protein